MKKFVTFSLALMLTAGLVYATALTAARNTPVRAVTKVNLTVKNDAVIYAGAMVAVDGNGEALNAADTSGHQVVGRAAKTVDNAADGLTIDVEIGCFGWVNSDTVSDANIGDLAYVVDNQTVSVTNSGSNAIIAGTIVDVDSNYVWVDTGFMGNSAGTFTTLSSSGAATLNSLGVTGNATVGGTLGVTGVMTLTAAPKVTAVTAVGTATAVMTNAPAITEETPIWITVTYGANNYVIPAWDLD